MAIKIVFYALGEIEDVAELISDEVGFEARKSAEAYAASFPGNPVFKYRVTLEKIRDDEKA